MPYLAKIYFFILNLIIVISSGLLVSSQALAYTLEEFKFENPARADEFRELLSKLRCLVCQNESLAGSQAAVAQDLREEIYRMMQEGKQQSEIRDFLVARYGDFVLYDPPLKPATYLLWFGPFLLIGLSGYWFWRTVRQKRSVPESELSEAEQDKLNQLFDQLETQKNARGCHQIL